jgi:hypothetical protein
MTAAHDQHGHDHGPDCDHGHGMDPRVLGALVALVLVAIAAALARRRAR